MPAACRWRRATSASAIRPHDRSVGSAEQRCAEPISGLRGHAFVCPQRERCWTRHSHLGQASTAAGRSLASDEDCDRADPRRASPLGLTASCGQTRGEGGGSARLVANRRCHAARRLSDGQSGRARKAHRIWLACRPPLPPFRGDEAMRPSCSRHARTCRAQLRISQPSSSMALTFPSPCSLTAPARASSSPWPSMLYATQPQWQQKIEGPNRRAESRARQAD